MRVGGVLRLKINNDIVPVGEGALTINLGGITREAVVGASGVAGFKSKYQPASIEGDLLLTRGVDVKQVTAAEDATVIADLYNGKTFILRDAWFVETGDFSTDGTMKFKFQSTKEGELIDA